MGEIAYEKSVTTLERAWEQRIDAKASDVVDRLRRHNDVEDTQLAATEIVAAWLLNDLAWEGVEARDISDIAYEAVGRAIAKGY